MIDYRQRLVTNKRNTFDGDASLAMTNEAATRGRMAMGVHQQEHFQIGQPLDALVVHATSHLLATTSEKNRLSTLIYTSDSSRNLGTLVNGKWIVKAQHHENGHSIKPAFVRAMHELKNR